ncbi:MAG: DNA primase [Steroidobacteraceae bacterium]
MSGRIPQTFIDDLVSRTDIVELIGGRVPLKKAGREYRACCPFHDEKTPSFWVSPAKQFYHCFGCGAHGTSLGFLMAYDHMAFPEAVEELASRLGLEVPREGGGPEPQRADDDLYSLLAQAAQFFRGELVKSPKAREYASKRGLTEDSLERFGIGYSPASWNDLLRKFGSSDSLRKKLLEAGLVIERDGESRRAGDGHYDRFRDRLMFPIRDARGRVLAFGGRIIDQGEPKYLNSPETPLFHKGRELYGLYEVRQQRTTPKRLMVVEGYMDVVRLHQAGLTYAVATLGTATTPEHLKRAFRVASEIVFCFDGDRAGRAAAWRALNNALPEARAGREMRFLFLPDGEDPDSLVGKEGAAAFEARFAQALPLSEYLVQGLLEDIDVRHADGKARFVADARPLLDRVPAGPYRELLLDRLAQAIGVSAERFLTIVGPAPPVENRQAAGAAPAVAPPRTRRSGMSAGRGGLVSQSIKHLLDFPASAAAIGEAQRSALATVQEPGVAFLVELLDGLADSPATSAAQVLERYRERHEYGRLVEIASAETLAPEAKGAAAELREAVDKLIDHAAQARLDALLEKSRGATLDGAEKDELRRLMSRRVGDPYGED